MASNNVNTSQPASGSVAVALRFLLDIHGVAYALTESQPAATVDVKIQESWQYANKVCRHTILQTLSNELFDVFCSCKEAKQIWEALVMTVYP